MTRKTKDGLKSKVMVFPLKKLPKDKIGSYIPYCDFGCHRGLILAEEVCDTRNCSHRYKLYIVENGIGNKT